MSFLENLYQSSPIFFQTLMLNGKALELYFERYGKKFDLLYKEFERNQYLSSSDLKRYQTEKLKELVDHAYRTVPYYKDTFEKLKLKPTDIASLDDLYKIPILTKEDIKANYQRLISTSFKENKLRPYHL